MWNINTQRPGVRAGLPPVLIKHLPYSQWGSQTKGPRETAAEVGGLVGKAGVGQEPGGKRAEGTLSAVRESRKNAQHR